MSRINLEVNSTFSSIWNIKTGSANNRASLPFHIHSYHGICCNENIALHQMAYRKWSKYQTLSIVQGSTSLLRRIRKNKPHLMYWQSQIHKDERSSHIPVLIHAICRVSHYRNKRKSAFLIYVIASLRTTMQK